MDIGARYTTPNGFTFKVGSNGVITGLAPITGTPPLPGFTKISSINTVKKLWQLTSQGASKTMRHRIWGMFYKSKSDGLWWVKDQTQHGGSVYKVYKETSKGLEWYKDADQYGDFIINKHKGNSGIFISWKELIK